MIVLNAEASKSINTEADEFFFYRDLLAEVENEIEMRQSKFFSTSRPPKGRMITKITVDTGGHELPQVIEGSWTTFEVSVLFPVSYDDGDSLLRDLSPCEQECATVVFYDDDGNEMNRDVRTFKEDLMDVVPPWYTTALSQDI